MKNTYFLIFFLLFWFAVSLITGAMVSGFHFTDDHDIVRFKSELSHSTITKEAGYFLQDLTQSQHRFRPLYQFHRRITTAVLGTNFTAWSVYFMILAALTSYFLFLFLRMLHFSPLEASLFALLTLLGEQAAIWWKLGANEPLGMFMLSLAFLYMAKSVLSDKRQTLYNALFIFFTLLATWSKESFILMVPGLIVWKILLSFQMPSREAPEGTRVPPLLSFITQGFNKHWFTVCLLMFICVVELLHIVLNVGTTGIQYAGYSGFNIPRFIETFVYSLKALHGWVILPLIIIISYLLTTKTQRHKGFFKSFAPLLWPIILSALIILPQILLHMKSGIMERYLMPASLGYAFLSIVFLRHIRLNNSRPVAGSFVKGRAVKVIIIVVLSLIALQQLRVVRYTAIAFAQEGKFTNQWFQSIEQSTNVDDRILIITDPIKFFEPSISFKTYLNIEMGRIFTLFSPVTVNISKTGVWKALNDDLLSNYPELQTEIQKDIDSFKAILIFPGLEKSFLKANGQWFRPASYKRYANKGNYIAYYSNKSKLETK
jgi:hypothetical protein